ncbi:branched-chain amino acid ABC transporter permease [Pararobbsia silviterrae]|uniref:Branched-chain amino acid ABC transporter permease n=1 Tax=Pararobbsia silviterrae TaxID=1792498 RepID=A0A494Y664_9BURK|nr:branched-chain amino acid ABC transporter permease [Pararobbsia silviterrae]RKP55816.1 branched-chain amino acid ABC transporter permease [Pararobbsia silviterrae]
MNRLEGKLGWAVLFVLGLVFPLVAHRDYLLTVMSTAYIFALATIGLNLITGYTGQYNLAHSGFMAIGAYTVGILTVDHQVPFWIAFLCSGLVCLVFGFFVGILSLRLKGHYFSIFTLCVGYILYLGIEKWDGLTHGVSDIIGIPAPTIFGLSFDRSIPLYYLTFAFLVLGIAVMHRVVHSLLGRTFMAIRNSDTLAESIGINLMRNKVLAFMLSVVFAGYAGGLYAGALRFLAPDLAGVDHTFDMTMYMLVGGMGTLFGPLLGALVVPWLTQYLQFLQEYRFVVFGPLLILLVIFLPNGLVGLYYARKARRTAHATNASSKAGASASTTSGLSGASSLQSTDPTHPGTEKGHA